MKPALRIVLICLAVVAAHPAQAGGAWPRGKGKVFASVSWSSFGDLAGYVAAIQGPLITPPTLEMTEEIGTYAEFGVTDRLTFGVDRYDRPALDTGSSIWFLRSSLGRLDWQNKYAAEIGVGPYRDWRCIDDTALRLGASWGRGLETRWGSGWVDVDAKIATLQELSTDLWKVDSTLGFKPNDTSVLFVQVQSGAIDDFPTYTRLVPTYVRHIWRGISLESALLLGLRNDNSQGVKIGAWLDF